ncbi:MAG: hypothetical protein EA397_12175 [Deltaproteobacteria bacterium]|nr:MAG: hypothetical protein EA397_12175 [Deltaproteobacteria bacterium]
MRSTALCLCLVSMPALAWEPPTLGDELNDGPSTPDLDQPELGPWISEAIGDRDDAFIINGREATVDEFPMSGGLLAKITGSAFGMSFDVVMFMCSSTLIAPDVVLTAAHCVDEDLLNEQTGGIANIDEVIYAWTPEVDLSMYGLGGPSELPSHAHASWDFVMHPSWVGARNIQLGTARNHDIALVFLEEPVTDIPHGYLIRAGEAEQLQTDKPVTIVGWGNQEPVPPGQQPEPGKVAIKHIAESFIGEVGETEFQVGVGPESSRKCQGDSGGPTYLEVVSNRATDWRVIGATSHTWDMNLCENTGGVDTRVDYYLDWIDDEMTSRCEDESRSWCTVAGIVPPPPSSEEEGRACGCAASASPSGALPLFGLFGLLALRRRR